jgi:hypothetical protein
MIKTLLLSSFGFKHAARLITKRAMESAEAVNGWGQHHDITMLIVTYASKLEAVNA